ncbi:hypothetical protein ACLOJK_000939 [Asimina triloba]
MRTASSKVRLLLSVILIFSITGWSVSDGQDLIAATCKQTLYFDVCVSLLKSDPRSHTADLQGLLAISLNQTIAQGQQMIGNLTALKDHVDHVSGEDDSYVAACLNDCLVEYSDAVENLRQSLEALGKEEYEHVNDLVSAAMTDSGTCEDGLEEETGHFSPLWDSNDYFWKLCSISLAITKLF